MNTLFLASNAGAAGGSNMMMLVMLIIIGVLFMYFGMIRPQKKQQQKRMEMMDSLKKGDRVILVDGLHGKVDSINDKDKTVVIDADGIYLTFSRMAIRQILPGTDTEAAPVKAEEKSEAPSENKTAETTEEKPAEADKSEETTEESKD